MKKLLFTAFLSLFSIELPTQEAKSLPTDFEFEKPEDVVSVSWDSLRSRFKGSEGLRLEPYVCPAGYPTIGYGHLIAGDSSLMQPITQAKADSLLREDMAYCEKWVRKNLNLTGNKLKAITAFCYSFGTAKLRKSHLFQKIKNGEPIDQEILKWVKINGKPSKYLLKARKFELALYKSPM